MGEGEGPISSPDVSGGVMYDSFLYSYDPVG